MYQPTTNNAPFTEDVDPLTLGMHQRDIVLNSLVIKDDEFSSSTVKQLIGIIKLRNSSDLRLTYYVQIAGLTTQSIWFGDDLEAANAHYNSFEWDVVTKTLKRKLDLT